MSDTSVPAVPLKRSLLSNTTYDRLKWVALVGLPALGALYYTLAQIWHLPKPEEVMATVLAVDTALGALLGIAKKNYNNSDEPFDGDIGVYSNGEKKTLQFSLNVEPEDILNKDAVTFQIIDKGPAPTPPE